MKERCFLGLKLVGVVLVFSMGMKAKAAEPNSVGDIFKEKGFEWLIGSWETVTDTNEKAIADFAFELDGYVLSLDARVGERYAYRGIVFYVPSKATLVNSGVDTRGDVLSGTWEIEGDNLVLKGERTAADGKIYRFVRYQSKVDADTMKVVTYRIVEGKRSEEPNILVFKRRK
jgi:hypothetical protein